MVQVAELDADRETIEATLNYFVDTGAMPVSLVGTAGGTDTRVGGGQSTRGASCCTTAGLMPTVSRSSGTASALCITTPRSPISTTRTRSAGSITRRWKRW